jgi:hypothetical protein
MKRFSRSIFSLIWVVLTGAGFGYSSELAFGFSSFFTPTMVDSATPAIFLLGPLFCGGIAYLLFPALYMRRERFGFGLTLNLALAIPFAALVFVTILYFIVLLFSDGVTAAFIGPFTLTLAVVSVPAIWCAIFGSGAAASIASRVYLGRA